MGEVQLNLKSDGDDFKVMKESSGAGDSEGEWQW